LREALTTLLVLQRSGTLDQLAEIAEVGWLVSAALDDEMASSLASTGAALGGSTRTAASDDTRDGIETLLQDPGAAARASPEPVGAVGLVRRLRGPKVQYGLGYLPTPAAAIGRERTPAHPDSG